MRPAEILGPAFAVFAARHSLSTAAGAANISGVLDGVALSITRVNRRAGSRSGWVTRFVATSPIELPGSLVVYTPNFRWRLPGPRRVSDDPNVGGLLGFVHHDPLGDVELDRALVVQATDVSAARALLTAPEVKQALLGAIARAGHLRIEGSQVALDIADRRGGALDGLLDPVAAEHEIEALSHAATGVVRALCSALERLRGR